MLRVACFVIACLAAAAAPLVSSSTRPASDAAFPGWPHTFEGQSLSRLPLSDREASFAEGFPGRVGRFGAGGREVVMRWVSEETRMLHPAADCFEGLGYTTRRLTDAAGWGRFEAAKDGERLLVRERIFDETGGSWTDVSAWYWAAVSGRSRGPWWSITTAERIQETSRRLER